MKTFRLVVALRLAIFPLIFNLTFAQEVEVVPEEMEQISPTHLYQEGQENQEVGEENTSLIKEGDVYHASMDEVVEDLDSSTLSQNDELLSSRADDEGNEEGGEGSSNDEQDVQGSLVEFTTTNHVSEGQGDVETTPQPQLAEQASAAPLTGSETLENNLPLCEERGTACGGEVDENSQDFSLKSEGQENIFLFDKGGEPLAVEDLQKLESDTPMDFSSMPRNDNEDAQDSPNEDLELEIPPTPLIKGGNPEIAPLAEDGGITLTEGEQETPQGYPNLIISEIYRLGTTERIEITNLSNNNFSGKLSLSGVKSSLYTKNLDIPSYSSIILADKAEIGLINDEILAVNNAGFNITDSDEISISLIYSGIEIDTFNVDKSIVSDNQIPTTKPRPSFQKIYNNGREIQITTTDDIFNITGNFLANPGKIVIECGNPWIGNGPSGNLDNPGCGDNPSTGDITGEDSDFNLIVSEVFYDDDDEWIEIFNIGNGDFLGDIEIIGNIFSDNQTNYTYQNIQIPADDFLIIADSDKMFDFSSISNGNVNILLNEGNYPQIFISDTDEIQISLFLSGQQIDSFFAHEYRVNKRDDYGVSFHKILTQNGPIVTRSLSNDDANLSEDIYNSANPGVFYTYADEIIDYGLSPQDSPQEDNSDTIDCSNVENDIITISEVFRGGSRYDPFVEFFIHEDIQYEYDSLLLSGSLLTQPITIDLDRETENYDREKLQKNTRLILTTKAGPLTEAGLITIVLHSDLNFNSFSGELELYGIDGQSRQLLDIVKTTTGSPEKSNYTAGYNHRCGITMDNVMEFSPGFDESALRYFSTTSKYNEKIVEKVKYVGGGGGCSCPSKAELCGTSSGNGVETGDVETTPQPSAAPLTGSEISPLTGGVPDLSGEGVDTKGAQIKIVSLEPKTPESITLQSFLPYDIDFKNHNYYLKTSTATTKKYIDGILYANTIDTFIKNFGFVDAGACIYLYSGDVKLDSYCYSSKTSEKEPKEEKSKSFNPSDYQLSITDINYDPEGNDSGNETITIKSNSQKPLDLSKIKMKVNAITKKISGTLEPYSSITLKGNFGFPNSTKDNSDVVVTLFYENHIFSTYTYNPNKPKIEIPDGAVKVYSVIDGDTFRYRKEDGSLQSVRLLGVDAPESNTARYRTTECFGKEAKTFLTNLIKNQYVTLEYDENSASSDAYGRMLAYVYLDGKLVNETLIAQGYAKEYTYKTAYSQQSTFKKAEENAKRSEKGLRSSSICGKSIAEEPEARGVDYEKLSIKISNVIYDPDGTDEGNEIIQLVVDNSQISTLTSVDFSDDFILTIFPRSEYATGTTKTKKLSEFGLFDLSLSSEITMKGNFGLPNNRATCVSLNQGSYTFDTWCYNPNGLLTEEELIFSGQVSTSLPNVKIQSIIPNPSGKDNGKEEITLLRTPSQDFPETLKLLNLNPDFSLLINGKTKKKLDGNLVPNQKITIKGSFSLPNSASCISLIYKGEELDKFCYSKASDGVKFSSDNTSVHEIPAEELSIVKKITLVKRGDKLCISYNKTLFSCKSIPNSTTEKNKKQLSMQNTFISELEKYIKSNYSMIYYNSEIKDYFDLYSNAKKAIKSGSGNFTRDNKNISITDISSLFQFEYEQEAKDYFIAKIQEGLPKKISSALHQLEEKYINSLLEKSDLDFLSLAQ